MDLWSAFHSLYNEQGFLSSPFCTVRRCYKVNAVDLTVTNGYLADSQCSSHMRRAAKQGHESTEHRFCVVGHSQQNCDAAGLLIVEAASALQIDRSARE